MSLLVALVVMLSLVGLQLIRVQVIDAGRYVAYGEEQRLRGIDLPAGRGIIFDRHMEPLAQSVPRQTVVADPRAVIDAPRTARVLARLLDADADDIYDAITQPESSFAYVARQVEEEPAQAVEDEELKGIWTIEEPQRAHPADSLALSLLGQVDTDEVGVSGLELAYEEELTGTDGSMLLERDPQGRTIPAGRHEVDAPVRGEDLVLTIDRKLQFEAEQVMTQYVQETGSNWGTAIVSDPRTGEIFAMANVGRDGETGEVGPTDVNHALVTTYEPGSVMKAATMATALEEGVVTPDTELVVPSSIEVGGQTFTDDSSHPTQPYTVREILAESSNVGSIMVAREVGEASLYDYLVRFGLAQPTGLRFPDEATGLLAQPEDWSGTSIATIPLGQGVSVTPMQMHQIFNVIANDGAYIPPTLVGGMVDADGERQTTDPGQPRQVVSPETAQQVREMMAGVVDHGTGTQAAIDGYDVAGKTGTARKPNLDIGGYLWPDGYRYTASFGGFLPADNPELSVMVVLDEPDGTYASSTAAPAFAEVSRHALRLLDVPPTAG